MCALSALLTHYEYMLAKGWRVILKNALKKQYLAHPVELEYAT
jgi:hypothetical protein